MKQGNVQRKNGDVYIFYGEGYFDMKRQMWYFAIRHY